MHTSSDNVYPFPTLEKRALHAMAEYQAGIADETTGKGRAIRAVIEYGKALLEGRKDRSNIAFKVWVISNKLDVGKPWSDRKEREKSMRLAELVGGNAPPNAMFDDCPNTRPADIMKWYRKKHPLPDGVSRSSKPMAPQIDLAYQAIVDWKQLGKSVPGSKVFSHLIGVSEKAAEKAVKRWHQEHRQEANAATIDNQTLATVEGNFSEKSKLTIADAIRIHQHRLDKMFETKVGEEVRRHIAAADEAMRKQNAQLRKENLAVTMLLRQGALFTSEEYKTILRCLHPDNSASSEMRARAFDLVKQKEKRLVGAI